MDIFKDLKKIGITDILKTVETLCEEGSILKSETKKFTTLSGSEGMFHYTFKAGSEISEIKKSHFGLRPGKNAPIHPRKVRGEEKVVDPDKAGKEYLVDVFDEKDHIKVVMELPDVKEKDIDFKIKDGVLKITAKAKGRKIKKDITIPKDITKFKNVSFKNNVLEINLKKKVLV